MNAFVLKVRKPMKTYVITFHDPAPARPDRATVKAKICVVTGPAYVFYADDERKQFVASYQMHLVESIVIAEA